MTASASTDGDPQELQPAPANRAIAKAPAATIIALLENLCREETKPTEETTLAEDLKELVLGPRPAGADSPGDSSASRPDDEAKPGNEDVGEREHRSLHDDPDMLPNCLYGLLKFLTDDKHSAKHWQAVVEAARDPKQVENGGLSRCVHDRDGIVLALWTRLERTGEDFVRRWKESLTFHRHQLFDWLMNRYDIRRARAIWRAGWWSANAHLLLLGLAGTIAALHTLRWPIAALDELAVVERPSNLLLLLAYLVVVSMLAGLFRSKAASASGAVAVALQSLVPRVAGASAAGVVILASSAELLRFVVKGASWGRPLVLVGGSILYLLLEMSRRIHPIPRPGRLLLHAFDVSATAFAHAVALTVVSERGLRWILEREITNDQALVQAMAAGPLNAWQLLNVAAFLFAIGLIVNLIWAEEPVTQPL